MTHRGMTLIELLVSLGLLSVIAMGVSAWMGVASAARATAEDAFAIATIQRVFQRIEEDLATGDFDTDDEPRVFVSSEELVIRTRGRSPDTRGKSMIVTYRRNSASGALERWTNVEGIRTPRLLAVEVREVAYDVVEMDDRPQIVIVEITMASGRAFKSELVVP